MDEAAKYLYNQDMIVVECKEIDMRDLLLNQKKGKIGIGKISKLL